MKFVLASNSLVGRALPREEVIQPLCQANRDKRKSPHDLVRAWVQFHALKLSDFKGQPTLINFWAPWCGPCMEEFPVLQRIQESHKGKLRVVAIAVQDKRLNVLEFIKKNTQYKFTFLTDPGITETESRLSLYFGIREIPVTLFVNGQSRVLDRWYGFSGEEELIKRIEKLTAQ